MNYLFSNGKPNHTDGPILKLEVSCHSQLRYRTFVAPLKVPTLVLNLRLRHRASAPWSS